MRLSDSQAGYLLELLTDGHITGPTLHERWQADFTSCGLPYTLRLAMGTVYIKTESAKLQCGIVLGYYKLYERKYEGGSPYTLSAFIEIWTTRNLYQ